MDSQVSKKSITEEEFRSCYPDVSIQHLSDKASPKVLAAMEKHQVKPQLKATQVSKSPAPKLQTTSKVQQIKIPQNNVEKTAIPVTKLPTAKMVQSKISPLAKTPATPKNNSILIKNAVMTNQEAVTKTVVTSKTPVTTRTLFTPNKVVSPALVTKATTATPAKSSPAIAKTPQTILKQKPVNIMKQNIPIVLKGPASSPLVKEETAEQSTMTVVTYQTIPQRSSKQLSIEKKDEPRIPVLDSSNQVVLQQVINNNGQLVLQNRVTPIATSVQSVVIGTTQATVVPQVEITTSEPLQALQVTQQVTLYGPKGMTVDDVKKQINKQNAMTNVVSSTTNSVPAPTPTPSQSVLQEQKKTLQPLNRSPAVKSPTRQVRGSVATQQYSSTRGQTKHVAANVQKVTVMPPPPPPPPQMIVPELGSEEEVTTSNDIRQQIRDTKLLLLMPSGEKEIKITDDLSLSLTIKDILEKYNIEVQDNVSTVPTEVISQCDAVEKTEASTFEPTETVGPEPGEICGLQAEVDAGSGEAAQATMPVPEKGEIVKEEITEAVFRKGLLAVCGICGISSENFSRCTRCSRVIPPDCKTISADLSQKSRKTKADSVTSDGSKKKRVCKRRKTDEPVCLTISDDEELLGLAHHVHGGLHSLSSEYCAKEPIITDEMVAELKYSASGGGVDSEERLDNAPANERTYLQCRTVRIGSYKVVPKDRLLVTPYGLKFTVPVVGSDQYVELKIMYHEVIKVLMHFGRQMPVLFFYTRPSAAAKIRKALRMEDRNGFYYDTTSSDETHRRITFLPDKIDDDCKLKLKNIFGNSENNIFAELTGKEANDILVKASPKEVQAFILKKQPNNNPPQPFDGQDIHTIMVYPPPPEKGGIPINTEDYACLGEDQFLNDVIIDFYLKYVVEKTLSPEDRARTHVFSSFFYKRLTTKPPAKRRSMNPIENDPTASPAAKRHSRVKSWTKNVNLFAKDFIVIPINENSHWFLAILCFPGLTGPVRFSDNTPIELAGRKKKTEVSGNSVSFGSTTITNVSHGSSMVDMGDDVEDRDEADGEDEDMDVPDVEEEPVQKPIVPEVKEEVEDVNNKKQREPIKQPCILIFDSLAGASRSRVVATLRDYLRVEYEVKHGEGRDFSGDVMKGSNVRCPQQTNYTDCGLYVLQYVEAFFQWPVTDYHIPIKQLQDWFQADIVSRKRYEIQQLLHRLMKDQGLDMETLNLPMLNLRPEGKIVDYSGTEGEEEEDDDDEELCEEEDDMMDDDAMYDDEMGDENEEMEEGEIGHHDDDENYLDPSMDHEEHEMDDEMDYCMNDEEDDLPEEEEELGEKELDDVSLSHLRRTKGENLKNYRIPRLATKNSTENSSDQLD